MMCVRRALDHRTSLAGLIEWKGVWRDAGRASACAVGEVSWSVGSRGGGHGANTADTTT